VSSERDLLLTHQRSDAHGLLAVGGPTFDGVTSTSVPKPPAGEGAVTALRRSAESPCRELENLHFSPLAGTLEEVRDIARLWSAAAFNASENIRVLTARQADETTFKREAPGHRVLHLATHGFFLKGPCSEERSGLRSVGGIVSSTNGKPSTANAAPTRVDYPLLLSGVALAGANGQETRGADEDDGILTAEEVAAINLEGVEWAVLSACDTGVGEVRAGEGVLGLRRSFEIAGARTVIMSLWPVEDEATRAWMTALYEGRLNRHLSTISAVRQASLAVLNARRARGQNTDPFFWAAFVAAGDWR
jgi:CHAT domain-containing protein